VPVDDIDFKVENDGKFKSQLSVEEEKERRGGEQPSRKSRG